MEKHAHNPQENSKHSQILLTAQRLFIKQGYAEVSMDALAQAVPVSKPTLYNHFKDKKALFLAVMESRCIFISDSIKKILVQEESSPEKTLTKIGTHFLSVVLSPEAVGIYRMAITHMPHFPDIGTLFYNSGPMRCKHIFSAYLEKLHARGELHVPNPVRAADVFFSMLVGRTQMRLLLGVDKQMTPKEIKEHTQYVVGVFLRGQQPSRH